MRILRFLTHDLSVALFSLFGLLLALSFRFILAQSDYGILLFFIICGGIPTIGKIILKLFKLEFGSDFLAVIAVLVALALGELYAGLIVVLMLSGGAAIEAYASERAGYALKALAKRMPSVAHLTKNNGFEDINLEQVKINDLLTLLPFETCPVDGEVIEGFTQMDESYLTGEPFKLQKSPGSSVISGAINGEGVLKIRADKLPANSRYAKIMEVMKAAEDDRPKIRRLADRLGAWYTPIALVIASLAWIISSDATRFLSVLIVATPCPLLIAIPVSIIGAISLCAKQGIIIRNPSILEQINSCTTIILDKTGTLTYGLPQLTEVLSFSELSENEILQYAGSIEQYSRHPLASAILQENKKRNLPQFTVSRVSEKPGTGLTGIVNDQEVVITSRKKAIAGKEEQFDKVSTEGLECWITINNKISMIRFRDQPRTDGESFIKHLGPKHKINKIMIISGDKESEVRHLAEQVGISEIYASQSPEQKVEHIKREGLTSKVLFVGDGINDAPALTSAHVGVAFGQASDVTSESADAVILDSSLTKLDQLFHISNHMYKIALQSAVGGMALSIVGMLLASAGYLSPVAGAISQELIDLFAVLNALRASSKPAILNDLV